MKMPLASILVVIFFCGIQCTSPNGPGREPGKIEGTWDLYEMIPGGKMAHEVQFAIEVWEFDPDSTVRRYKADTLFYEDVYWMYIDSSLGFPYDRLQFSKLNFPYVLTFRGRDSVQMEELTIDGGSLKFSRRD